MTPHNRVKVMAFNGYHFDQSAHRKLAYHPHKCVMFVHRNNKNFQYLIIYIGRFRESKLSECTLTLYQVGMYFLIGDNSYILRPYDSDHSSHILQDVTI